MEIGDTDNLLGKLAQIISNYVFTMLPWFVHGVLDLLHHEDKLHLSDIRCFVYCSTFSQFSCHLPVYRYLPRGTKLSKSMFQNLPRIFSKKSSLSAILPVLPYYLILCHWTQAYFSNINRNLTFQSPKTVTFLSDLEYLQNYCLYHDYLETKMVRV